MSPMPSLYIYIRIYVICSISSKSSGCDNPNRCRQTNMRNPTPKVVMQSGGQDSRNGQQECPLKSHLLGLWFIHSYLIIFGYRNSSKLARLQGPFVPCHWWQCELHRWGHSRSWSELLRKVCFFMSTSKLHFTRPLCFAWWTCKH